MLFFVLSYYVMQGIGDPHTKLAGADNVLLTVYDNLDANDVVEI